MSKEMSRSKTFIGVFLATFDINKNQRLKGLSKASRVI